MNLEQTRIDYERDGVARIPGVFTKPETDYIRAAATVALMTADPDAKYRSGRRMQILYDERAPPGNAMFPSILFWPALLPGGYLNTIRTDPRMVGIVQHFLGPDVKQLNNQVYYRLPGDGDAFNWHQDVMFRKGLTEGHSIAEDYLQTVICVDQQYNANGTLAFVRGSHLWPYKGNIHADKEHLREYPCETVPWPLDKRTWMVEANPGDVLIWNVMTLHASYPNKSARSRMTYMNGFCRARSSEAWPWYIQEGLIQHEADPESIPYV